METETLREFVRKHNRVYCYGAGHFGRRFGLYARRKHISIEAYIVSNSNDSGALVYGWQIRSLAECKFISHDGVIITVFDDKAIKEIKTMLATYTGNVSVYLLRNDEGFKTWENRYSNRYKRKKYKKSVENLKRKSIFDFRANVKSHPWLNRTKSGEEINPRAIPYGIDRVIRNCYKGIPVDIYKSSLAHGAAMWSLFDDYDRHPENNVHFCMSDFYEKQEMPNLTHHVVGNYINYIKPLYSKRRMCAWKKRLGRTLLVFPVHSTYAGRTTYNQNFFIAHINDFCKEQSINSILVCLHPADIANGDEQAYLEAGFRIVTGGSGTDYNFMRRLKSIISLADVAITNALGTHVGYIISMNKPLKYIAMKCFNPLNDEVFHTKYYTDRQKKEYNENIAIFERLFSDYNGKISSEQLAFVRKYWGSVNEKFPRLARSKSGNEVL